MEFKTVAIPRVNASGQVVDGKNLFCNFCSSAFATSIGYFRCDDARCDFDACARCGMSQNARQP